MVVALALGLLEQLSALLVGRGVVPLGDEGVYLLPDFRVLDLRAQQGGAEQQEEGGEQVFYVLHCGSH